MRLPGGGRPREPPIAHPRSILAFLLMASGTFLFSVPAILLFAWNPYHRHATGFLRLWSRFILGCVGGGVDVIGTDNVKGLHGAVFLSNHQSFFDIPAILASTPVPVRMVAKKELFRIPFLGWAMAAARFIPLDRSHRRRATATMETVVIRLKNRKSILLFPEGTRSVHAQMAPFKMGAFRAAQSAGVPIVPIVVTGSRDLHRMAQPWRLYFNRRITVEFLEPIAVESFGNIHPRLLADRVRARMDEVLFLTRGTNCSGNNLDQV